MKITTLGTGSAFCLKNYQTSFLIETSGEKLLIDCGGDIRFSLHAQGYSMNDIDAVYISHLHADHCGGLECLGFMKYFTPNQTRPKLFIHENLIKDLWYGVLESGMKNIEDEQVHLSTYFDAYKLSHAFRFHDLFCVLVQTNHINGMLSYGLMVLDDISHKTILFTTDTNILEHSIYESADEIYHDCETLEYSSGVHAHFNDLCKLPDDIKKKMHLCHYQDNVFNNKNNISSEWNKKVLDNGFKKIERPGSILEF